MQSVFKRYEKKYLISAEQHDVLRHAISPYMKPDKYGGYLVQNLYYDTEDWDVIRASVENPVFKEKLRIRCYGQPAPDSDLFLELKKKYDGIVYKRRLVIPGAVGAASQLTSISPYAPNISCASYSGAIRKIVSYGDTQIAREIDYYLKTKAVTERIYISYKRTAYVGVDAAEGLRVTFDTDIRFRLHNLDFTSPAAGRIIIPENMVLMEIKTPEAIPLWLARIISRNKIYPSSFSKYGVCYAGHITKKSAADRKETIIA